MDFQLALWTAWQLMVAPRVAARHAGYRRQARGSWARDDPAFVALLACALLACGAGYGWAFGGGAVASALSMAFRWLALGGALSTAAGLALARGPLARRSAPAHAADAAAEPLYCFDVHCNALVPILLELLLPQLALAPMLLRPTRAAALASAALHAAAISHASALLFWGYSALPFLERTEIFLAPIPLSLLLLPAALLFDANPSRIFLERTHPGILAAYAHAYGS